jgi:transposase
MARSERARQLRGFGLKVGKTAPRTFATRVRELAEGHPTLEVIVSSLLKTRDVLATEFAGFECRLRAIARENAEARRLMTTPGVGALVSMTVSGHFGTLIGARGADAVYAALDWAISGRAVRALCF